MTTWICPNLLDKLGVDINSQNHVNLDMKKEKAANLKSDISVPREYRYFTEAARKTIVEEIDNGLSKAEASRKYQVSKSAIFIWIAKYSKHYQPPLVKVVEHASQSNKVKKLEAELDQVYALLGRLKAESMLLEGIIEQADEALGTDLKKSFDAKRLQPCITKKTKSR